MLLSINTICIYKSVLDSLLYEKLVISIKMSYLLWQNDSMATDSQTRSEELATCWKDLEVEKPHNT